MSNLGGYQDIVVEAHQAGGTEIWLNKIKELSYQQGASDTKNKLFAPLLAIGVSFGVFGTIAYQKLSTWIAERKAKKLLTEKEALEAEEYLKKELSNI